MNTVANSGSADSAGLKLRLQPETAVFRHDDEPDIRACLTNAGDRVIRLVMPGDGSFSGWRTPVIEWTFTPDDGGVGLACRQRGCGNINGIKPAEVFTLAPGESRDLGSRILPPFFPGIAQFSASLTYSNVPAIPLLGSPLAPHDEAALALIRGSDACQARSNEINVSFEDYAADALQTWLPELVAALREQWSDGINCDHLVALRTEMQRQLGVIRAERGIHPGVKWILSAGPGAACRVRRWCPEPEISVRGLILAAGRFQIASSEVVSDLERRWRLFQREHELDMYGTRLRKPFVPPKSL